MCRSHFYAYAPSQRAPNTSFELMDLFISFQMNMEYKEERRRPLTSLRAQDCSEKQVPGAGAEAAARAERCGEGQAAAGRQVGCELNRFLSF